MTRPLDVAEALERIAEIHGHLDRGEVYRGYHPGPVAATGVIGVAAALLQPLVQSAPSARAFVGYWVAVAAVNLLLHWGTMAWHHVREDEAARRRTRRVVGQFVPSVAAGAMVTVGVLAGMPQAMGALPGVWAVTFALGIFSSRPYLPQHIGWVGLGYLGGGGVLLFLADAPLSVLGAVMGAVFGAGQLGAALVLHLDRRRQ